MKFTVNNQSQYARHGCYDFVENKPFDADGTYMFEGLTGDKYYGGTYENVKNLQTVNTNNNKWVKHSNHGKGFPLNQNQLLP